jgi:chromosomal replication initiation ATPase DnaA
LPGADISTLATGPVAVEDAHAIARDRAAEEALFHLHNLVLAEGHALLITAREAPALWGLGLPDLASRMAGTLMERLGPPDDALLAALLFKLFADRQLSPTPDTVPYLVRRIERSFDAAHEVVAALDARALDKGRAITRALAAEVLDKAAR